MSTTIHPLPLAMLEAHPNNPRRDLGDLTELVASIRAQGIRQNLLVTPEDEHYRVVIGHRRLAAAHLAGLDTVPCIIETLTEQQQLELMLVENLQRADLTVIEEARGYQDMLDLGMSQTEISSRTGRATSTIRSRVKLLDLPENAQSVIADGQATLEDAAVLNEFSDCPDLLEHLLDDLGTSEFSWTVDSCRRERSDRARVGAVVVELQAGGATLLDDQEASYATEGMIRLWDWKQGDAIPEGAVYRIAAGGNVQVFRPLTLVEQTAASMTDLPKLDPEEEERRAEEKRRREVAEQSNARRDALVADVLLSTRKLSAKEKAAIVLAVAGCLRRESLYSLGACSSNAEWWLTRTVGMDSDDDLVRIRASIPTWDDHRILLLGAQRALSASGRLSDALALAEALGYVVSTEERELAEASRE